MQKSYLYEIFKQTLNQLNIPNDIDLFFETPNNPDHGDLATNIAMKSAKYLKKKPRDIAEEIVKLLQYDNDKIEKIDIAGPGFINIKFSDKYYFKAVAELIAKGKNIGKQDSGKGKKVNVEYVSVNPTGLLHLGHGRNACIGDTVANLYEWLGYEVVREYYFNNAGNQMNKLADSIYARYIQIYFDDQYQFPESGYHGSYVKEIAKDLYNEKKDELKAGTKDDILYCRKFGEKWCFQKIRKTLERLDIKQDVFYNEESLYEEGKIDDLLNKLQEKNLVYEKEDAKWLKLSKLGLEQDRVIVKSSGEPTYRLPDIAYHIEKFKRDFDKIIDVFGSDHIATVPDVLATVDALGYDKEKVDVLIHQFVTLTEDGKQVKMSKRTGRSYTLDDLLDEVGADIVRYFLIMRSISTHLEFDLNLAKEQSEKNPVFYLQYAHARINSIFRKLEESGKKKNLNPDFSKLISEYEINLIKQLLNFEETIQNSARKYEPQILAEYLKETASMFHIFYHNCPILQADNETMSARLSLAEITKNTIHNGLTILGISAPEKM